MKYLKLVFKNKVGERQRLEENGSYDEEPVTIELMHKYMEENGYELDITENRYHHEIYLSDPRKCDASKLKTVIRHPIKKHNGEEWAW